jgi:hypothetical protein
VVQYFEKLSGAAVELRTKGQEEKEKEIEEKKGFCAVVFIPRANTTQGNLIRLSLSAALPHKTHDPPRTSSTGSHFPQTILFTEMREIHNIVTSCRK